MELRKYIAPWRRGGKEKAMDTQIMESSSGQAQKTTVSADAMRGYITNIAQNLKDEKLLRLLYLRAINLEAKSK